MSGNNEMMENYVRQVRERIDDSTLIAANFLSLSVGCEWCGRAVSAHYDTVPDGWVQITGKPGEFHRYACDKCAPQEIPE
jgi:hypothetical protein